MEILRLELPSEKREKDALEYKAEFREIKEKIAGDGGMDEAGDYDKWVQQKKNSHNLL